ncbi:MAG TPA: tRNA uridine-5-carboxymethylaminomethyl(34) synthesis enzyme MnmG [Firmicutes bacterium]|nr:tRNA uridine-5-carboxymethylaminomethyl(34) synthesis enzyme MnmG [Bacillota bacterium]
MGYFAGIYDVLVIGAGHAGIEASLAAARLGCRTAVFTINLDWVGNLPCNPSIGGTAKGHLVREIDALGGEMGKAADATFLQSRMLNRGKGPAVHSLRAQIDRRDYSTYMKHALEKQENLELRQAEIISLRPVSDADRRKVPELGDWPAEAPCWEAATRLGAVYYTRTVILATGTFLGGRIYVGDVSYEGGPDGTFAATALSASLKELQIPLRRFKTGTPARVHRRSIDFSRLEVQEGDDPVTPFSFTTKTPGKNRVVCHIAYTNQQTEAVIRANLHRSPLFSGKIEGVGPRYCPSIEDKIVRFPDKERHQLFIEPCGLHTEEMYLQGMSSSLPEDVQIAFYRTIQGLEHVQIMRNAYAIEYDCIDPQALSPTLECKSLPGFYGAGQFNGSSGYEEAAAQGLVAGINAARAVKGLPPVLFERSNSYIGTLVDDLVTKGCSDPYRMMTSRSEYRLLLRQDNADERLTPLGREIGLVDDAAWEAFRQRKAQKEAELARLRQTTLSPSAELNQLLVSRETSPLTTGARLEELLRRPRVDYASLAPFDPGRPDLPADIQERVETGIKYAGYIKRQMAQVEEMRRLECRLLPDDADYLHIDGLRSEAREKLQKVMPRSIGQAARISGVSPADISVLLIWLEKRKQMDDGAEA